MAHRSYLEYLFLHRILFLHAAADLLSVSLEVPTGGLCDRVVDISTRGSTTRLDDILHTEMVWQ